MQPGRFAVGRHQSTVNANPGRQPASDVSANAHSRPAQYDLRSAARERSGITLLALSRRTGAGRLGAPHRRLVARRSSDDYPAEPRPVAPHVPTPGKSLGQGIDLVVVTSWKSQEFGREIFKPRCSLGKPHRAAGEQIGLGDQARTLSSRRRRTISWISDMLHPPRPMSG